MKERVALSLLLAQNAEKDPPVSLVVPFAAMKDEAPVLVTAVLERTVAYHEPGDRRDTGLVRIDRIFVDPDAVEWKTSTAGYEGERLHGSKPANQWRRGTRRSATGQDLAATRANTDQEALLNQRQVKQAKEDELRFLRQRSAEQAAEKEKEEVSEAPTVETPFGLVAGGYSGSPMRVRADAQEKQLKLRHCHSCGNDKPKAEFKTKRGIGICDDCRSNRAEPGAVAGALAQVIDGGLEVLAVAKPKRKYTRHAKASKRGGRRKARAVAAPTAVPSTGHRNGRPSLTFKELIERIVGERDALKARVDELEAERAQAFAQLQEVLG